MYELAVTTKFSAAHQLRGYQGKCEALHGHTYKIQVRVRAEVLDDIGLAVDFKKLKQSIGQIIEDYDHSLLNEVPPYDMVNPSAENIARTVYEALRPVLPEGVTLRLVKVWESENAWASYFE